MKIIINEKTTQIPKRAFKNCPNLTTVELPKSISSIEDEALGPKKESLRGNNHKTPLQQKN